MALVRRAKTWASPSTDSPPDQEQSSTVDVDKDVLKVLKNRKKQSRSFFASRRFLFPLGILVGVMLGFALIEPSDIQEMHAQLLLLMDEMGASLPQLAGLDFSRVELEWNRFRSSIPEVWKFNKDGREFMVGQSIKERGLSADHPVILIPGVISTGLESWSTTPEYRPFFKEKVWGSFGMVQQVMFNKERWISSMMLDPITGLDPIDAKVRAAEGIDAASSFIQGYWIWSKIVENLAVVNYDTNNLHLAPYDWRLSYYNLEERDGYFSRLKSTIEGFKRRQKRKCVIVAHSMGSTVMMYFFKWVEHPDYGGGGSSWVEDYIDSYVTIAGTHLGVAKAMSAFLSGEMKDTVQMNPAGAYVLERFFSRKERQQLFRSWAGSASMWIKGGNAIWGNNTSSPDDGDGRVHTHGELIAFRDTPLSEQNSKVETKNQLNIGNMTADEASLWILEHTPSSFQKMMATNYSVGIERDEEQLKRNNDDHTKWSNPLEVQLPYAPSLKMYCVYGHGKPTERSYWYTQGPAEYDEDSAESVDATCTDPSDACSTNARSLFSPAFTRTSWIDTEYTDDSSNPKVLNGVRMGEGDGTVSLLSLGAMCVEGWKRPRWNPAGIDVKTIELPHLPVPFLARGGANTSDHVDILGSTGLNDIVVKVAVGAGHEVQENFVSNIREYAQNIQWD